MRRKFTKRIDQFFELSAFSKDFRDYWFIYGGRNRFFRSVWLYLSLILTTICIPLWTADDWQSIPLSIIPNLLGFSIGAVAIIFAFPTFRFFEIFAQAGKVDSLYMKFAARLFHFMVF